MTTFKTDRLKSSRTETQPENRSQTTRTPHVRHTSDGLEAELPARADYDIELLTVREAAAPEIASDGGSKLEVSVYRCGGCERTFTADDAVSSYTVEATGEQVEYTSDRCPHCGTPTSSDQTIATTATFDLTPTGADQ